MTARSHMVCVTVCPVAKPANTVSMMMMSLMLVFVVLVIVLEGWDDYIVEGKEAPDEEQCSD
jgi:hypothetical protein